MLMVCISHARSAYFNTYGVGYGVAVCYERQYQSLKKRNSKIAVPLFICILCRPIDTYYDL